MRKETLSRFFLGLIFGGITGIIAYSLNLPDAVISLLHNISGIGMAGFNVLIEVLIWPLSCLAFIDAFRLMWSMIRGHYGGGDSVRTYIATTIMAVLIALSVGSFVLNGLGQIMEFAPWLNARNSVLYFNSTIRIFYKFPLEAVCAVSAVIGVILAELDRVRGYSQPSEDDVFKTLYSRLIQFIYKMYIVLPVIIFLVSFEITARTGPSMFKFVLFYVMLVFLLIAIHVLVVYSGIIKLKLKLSPIDCFKKSMPLMRLAGWTINSRETVPITIQTATIKLGVPEGIARKVVLGGTTLNMDGTAIMQAVAILLTASIYDITFDAVGFWALSFMIVIIAMVTTAGTLTGMFTLGIVYHVFGVPLEMLAIIISISHVVSVAVTPVNILGDLVAAMVVADDLGRLKRDVFKN